MLNVDRPISEVAKRRSTCPICGSSGVRPYMLAPDNGHLRRGDVHLAVDRCSGCDVFFLNPPPLAEIGREYFAETYACNLNASLYYDDDFKDRVGQIRTEMLARYCQPPGRLLDVGCAKGHFVLTAKRNGWEAWGVELDAGACDYARTRLGLDTVFEGSTDHPRLPELFDVITLWDVIEHVPDPVACLRDAATKLGASGWIVLRTGNIRSWSFDKNRRGWWAFGSDHRFYFSPRSLGAALDRAGFTVVDILNNERVERPQKSLARDISQTPVSEGLMAIAKSPVKLLKLGRYGVGLARRLSGPTRFGPHYGTSIMTLVARKR